MTQNEQIRQQLVDILQQGMQDEMNSAYQYIALAGKYGDTDIKQAFLHYAQDELKHADKLLGFLRNIGEDVQEIPVAMEEQDDLYLYLIEYMAREESAVFYYETLEKLVAQPELQLLCKEMRGEEQLHLHQMRALLQKVKQKVK